MPITRMVVQKGSAFSSIYTRSANMSLLGIILLVVLVLLLIGALPRWPHSKDWGYAPGGVLTVLLVVLIVLLLMGRI